MFAYMIGRACVSGRVTEGDLPLGCNSRARSLTQHWQTMSAHTGNPTPAKHWQHRLLTPAY